MSLIDHIITNSSAKISGSGVIDSSLSDHQLIYCTRKLIRVKLNLHKSIKCRSTNDYTPDKLQQELRMMNFPNYETFDNIDKAYLDFSNKFSNVINKIAPFREKRIKNSNQDWFDGEISNAIFLRNKNFNNFKKTRSGTSL